MPVLLLDTYSLFFRAYHALPDMRTARGVPTSAVYGLCVLLLKLMREQTPAGLAFARDAPARTFRHEQYAGYKAARPAVPSPLVEQFHWLDRLLAALAVPAFSVPGYEADDVLATLARELQDAGQQVRIVTGDRDLFQVISEACDVLYVGRRGQKPVIYAVDTVRARFGVPPAALPDYVALVGDSSDNLPGVPGIGPRTAAKLIGEFGSVQALLSGHERVHPPKLRERLQRAAAQIQQNEQLARLRRDVPLGQGARYGLPSPQAFAALRELFLELEFNSLLARLPSSA